VGTVNLFKNTKRGTKIHNGGIYIIVFLPAVKAFPGHRGESSVAERAEGYDISNMIIG